MQGYAIFKSVQDRFPGKTVRFVPNRVTGVVKIEVEGKQLDMTLSTETVDDVECMYGGFQDMVSTIAGMIQEEMEL